MESSTSPGKRRIALLVHYDGTSFHGFQRQLNGHTVQAEIEHAVSLLTRSTCVLHAAGRTDTGVHALGQVVHFDTVSPLSLRRIAIGLNGIMSRGVSVKDAFHVSDTFHARFEAKSREYCYRIYNHHYRSPFADKRALWYPRELDIDRLNAACSFLVGEHDFASLCRPGDKSSCRRVISARIDREGDNVCLRIRADSFLHNMIRIITGTLLQMNEESLPPEFMGELIEKRDRRLAGETAPPWGLYLEKVEYSPPLETYPSASAQIAALYDKKR